MESSCRLFISICTVVICVKFLLIPAYRSTDFEVHRNWLAITHSLPISQWYTDDTSQWTLDYPPLFAWMEKLLSYAVRYFDPEMLVISDLEYSSNATIVFQRLSVIVSDIVMMYAVWCWVKHCSVAPSKNDEETVWGLADPRIILSVLSVSSVGLLIVDSIHFQYNGILSGILLLSVLRIIQRRHLEGALWFAILLNMKHIYLYVAPAYGVYLLRVYCFSSDKSGRVVLKSFNFLRFLSLGFIVAIVFAVSFGPFVLLKQIPQVLSRLFPFKRGLCHAYWAPNFWAVYNIADKVFEVGFRKLDLTEYVGTRSEASMTGGLVQEFEHVVLPTVKPIYTLVLTAVSLIPPAISVWNRPHSAKSFIHCVVMCAFSSYMFGWHVHEKAILLVTIPLACLVAIDKFDAKFFLLISTIGYYSLFPLLFTPSETPIKYCFLVGHILFSFYALGKLFSDEENKVRPYLSSICLPLLNFPETLYIFGLLVNEMYCQLIHSWLGLQDRLPFLPLMLTSVYCAVGMCYLYVWTNFRYYVLTNN